ncbi:hypothetical protein HG530_005588 [Fusarium avenaceum]|nr:hypothetical protein HG530_005588 [Fusarium avenaceum]
MAQWAASELAITNGETKPNEVRLRTTRDTAYTLLANHMLNTRVLFGALLHRVLPVGVLRALLQLSVSGNLSEAVCVKERKGHFLRRNRRANLRPTTTGSICGMLSALLVVDYRCGRFLHRNRLSRLGDAASRVVLAIATTVVSSNCKITPTRPSITASTTVLTLTTAIVLATSPWTTVVGDSTALPLALTATTIEAESSLKGRLTRGFSVTHDGMILRAILMLLLAVGVVIATGITRGWVFASLTLSFLLTVEITAHPTAANRLHCQLKTKP